MSDDDKLARERAAKVRGMTREQVDLGVEYLELARVKQELVEAREKEAHARRHVEALISMKATLELAIRVSNSTKGE